MIPNVQNITIFIYNPDDINSTYTHINSLRKFINSFNLNYFPISEI